MRTGIIMGVCALILLVPAAAADDPSYTVPDPTPLFDAAMGTKEGIMTDAADTASANMLEVENGAQSAQAFTLPTTTATNVAANTTGFAGRSAVAAQGFGTTGVGFAESAANQKVDEVDATATAVRGVALSALGNADTLTTTATGILCSTPLVDTEEPGACSPESIVAAIRGALENTVGNANETAQDQTSPAQNEPLFAAISEILNNIVG